jgi:selenide,water dikinase
LDLAQVLSSLPGNDDPRVLADFREASDAGVYLIDEDRALVQSVDFFTPIVDDPYTFGAVAAANALSDLYAMGARPLTALAIVAFPKKGVDFSVLESILRGGHEKLRESGAFVLGGHTVQDPEIKFGYAVTGEVQPKRLLSNGGAQLRDVLYLTKPIGTGVLATALKKNKLNENLRHALYESLVTLNRSASEAMVEVGVHAATDITGFGLLGHAGEMARASDVTLEIAADRVPLLPDAIRFQSKGYRTGGVEVNRGYVGDILELSDSVDRQLVDLFLDPQTSGGLLISVPEEKEGAFKDALAARNVLEIRIGRVGKGPPKVVVKRE